MVNEKLMEIIKTVREGNYYYTFGYSYKFNMFSDGDSSIEVKGINVKKIFLKSLKSEISDLDTYLFLSDKEFEIVERFEGYICGKEYNKMIVRKSEKINNGEEFAKLLQEILDFLKQ
ncbi:MAG: hypothetical protein NC915_06600 [Candidatus Omnitrophica bacterium]|nr:hypothetical protein [Candidatus Omnitrophota bacterium]